MGMENFGSLPYAAVAADNDFCRQVIWINNKTITTRTKNVYAIITITKFIYFSYHLGSYYAHSYI